MFSSAAPYGKDFGHGVCVHGFVLGDDPQHLSTRRACVVGVVLGFLHYGTDRSRCDAKGNRDGIDRVTHRQETSITVEARKKTFFEGSTNGELGRVRDGEPGPSVD